MEDIDYKGAYYLLFNAITDAVGQLNNGHVDWARITLLAAQVDSERVILDEVEE